MKTPAKDTATTEIRQIAPRTFAVFDNGNERARFATRERAEKWQAIRQLHATRPQPAAATPAPAASTPTPWRFRTHDKWDFNLSAVLGPPHADGGDYAAIAKTYNPANAALIVTAVNERAGLIAEITQLRAEVARMKNKD